MSCAVEQPAEVEILLDLGMLVCLTLGTQVQYTRGFEFNHVLCGGMPGRRRSLVGFGLLVCLTLGAQMPESFESNHVLRGGLPDRRRSLIGFRIASMFDFGRRSTMYRRL